MRNAILLVSLFVCFLCCSAREAEAQIQWNPECAVQAAQEFQSCRANGGKTFGCLIQAGFGYWQCSGSSLSGGPVRAAFVGRRAVRAARRM